MIETHRIMKVHSRLSGARGVGVLHVKSGAVCAVCGRQVASSGSWQGPAASVAPALPQCAAQGGGAGLLRGV